MEPPLTDKAPNPDAGRFQALFQELREPILEEWPDLEADALDATGGQLELVVVLVAEQTGRTRAVSRRLLRELMAELETPPEPRPRPRRAAREPEPRPLDPLERLFVSLESHVEDLTKQVKADVTPLAVDTVRQHLGVALLLAGGLGLMLGLFLGALGFPHKDAREEGRDADAS
ncbi:MAG: hypothetical protein V4850_16520 [Myxococcota bacterium]